MNTALALSLNLLALSVPVPADQHALAMVPPGECIADALAGILSQRELQQTKDMFVQVGSGDTSAAAAFRFANDLARAIKAKGTQPHQIAAVSSMNRVLEDIVLLRFIISSDIVEYIDMRPESLGLFHYIPILNIEPALGEPAVTIIGTLPQSIVKQDIPATSKSDSYIERGTEIIYGSKIAYPRLNLKLRSRRGRLDMKNSRFDWHQRPFPEYDLEICTFQERLLGSIQTRQRDLPYTVEGKKLRITIPKEADASLLETSILDENRKPLAHYVRLAIAQESVMRQA